MPFIGQQPTTGAFLELDSLTASATANYTLQLNGANYEPESVNNLLVSINGVIQGSNTMSLSGSTLTVGATLSSSDVIDFVRVFGNVGTISTPTDGSVTANKIGTGAVTSAKIADNAVTNTKIANSTIDLTTKITGTLPIANGGTGNIIKPYFKLQKSSNQSTPNGATVTVTWETSVYDTASIVDLTNNRVNITSATEGLWYVQANIMTDILNFRQVVDLRKNSSGIARFERATQTVANNGSRAPNISVNTIIEVANGDNLDVSYISVNGTNTISSTASGTYFYGWRIT